MWQKERLINYGVSLLPENTEYFAWIDCDILFLQDNWVELAIEKFQDNDILQLTKKIYFGTKGETEFSPFFNSQQSVIWQYKIHKNWLNRRKTKELPFSAPGFCFGARTEIFKDIGIYDRCITGSGDTFLIDILLGSSEIHGYSNYLTSSMIDSMNEYKTKLLDRKPRFDYIPVNILHLYHGTIANRNYLPRHEILRDNDYNPYLDIILENNVFEWNSDKKDMHELLIKGDEKTGEFIYIDIVVPEMDFIDYNTIEVSLSQQDRDSGLASEIYDLITQYDMSLTQFKVQSHDDKINELFSCNKYINLSHSFALNMTFNLTINQNITTNESSRNRQSQNPHHHHGVEPRPIHEVSCRHQRHGHDLCCLPSPRHHHRFE